MALLLRWVPSTVRSREHMRESSRHTVVVLAVAVGVCILYMAVAAFVLRRMKNAFAISYAVLVSC